MLAARCGGKKGRGSTAAPAPDTEANAANKAWSVVLQVAARWSRPAGGVKC